jgi:cystathionine beta-lyase/cystathionine gamma-synthase
LSEPDPRAELSAPTRALHDAIDQFARESGVPWLHPSAPTLQTEVGASARMAAWQEEKARLTMTHAGCWAELPPIYARYGTPRTLSLIQAVKELEQARAALVTDCGMQAIALTFDAVLRPGAHAIVFGQVYNKSASYLAWLAERMGGAVTRVADGDFEALEAACTADTALLFAETYTNPLLRAQDPDRLGASIERMRKFTSPQLRFVLDTTIATPWGLRGPALSWPGVDVVVASGTKALGGQDQDLWGYVATDDVELANRVMDVMAMRGGIVESHRAAVLAEGLRSRARADFERRCASAAVVADFLARHPRVAEVFHPSCAGHVDRSVIDRHYRQPGSLLSFRVHGADEDATAAMADRIAQTRIIRYALSFDGVATKVNHHRTVSEYFTPPPVLKRLGLDRLVRLGIGLEDPADLTRCLEWALSAG